MSNPVYDIAVKTIDGKQTTLGAFQGQVALVVNVASQCGLTKQYDALEKLYDSYREQGFVVLGFPSNEFAGQEPGSDAEIHAFCRGTFGVQFPMFSKIEVNGEQRHALYRHLIAAQPTATVAAESGFYQRLASKGRAPKHPDDILWNFEKFLIGRDGAVIQRFAPDMVPDDAVIVAAIDAAVAR